MCRDYLVRKANPKATEDEILYIKSQGKLGQKTYENSKPDKKSLE